MLAVTAFCLASGSLLWAAVPEAETAYGRSAFRLEYRPGPAEVAKDDARRKVEAAFAEAFDARWIAVVDPSGNPVFPNAAIPTPDPKTEEYGGILRKWVDDIHSHGLPVMSWYPLIISLAGGTAHPDWRQVSLTPNPNLFCCINSGYGDALIGFCNEALERLGLDGIWFDGSSWSNIWQRPIPLSCFCDSCRRKFREDTGLDLPAKQDWTDPTFRRWVAWRFKTFGDYIGRLAAGIRARHPKAAVVINHYHRPQIPWHSAIPIDLYDADIITGSEAAQAAADLVMRLCRAYGRSQSEVWRYFDHGDIPEQAAQTGEMLHHALYCFCAGGMPSFGYGGGDPAKAAATARLIAPAIKALRPFAGFPSFRHIAIHVSQQTETFYLGRDPSLGLGWTPEPFWTTLSQWTEGLNRAHLPPDYVFDKSLTPEGLKGYSVLLMPVSLGLTDAQARTVLDFAKASGLVVLGPATGQLDEWGEKRSRNPLAHALGFSFTGVYPPDARDQALLNLVDSHGHPCKAGGHHVPMTLASGWETLYTHAPGEAHVATPGSPAIATRPFGKGRVVVMDLDFTNLLPGWIPAVGGDTSITATTETAASGKRSLVFVDGPQAAQPFFPDMEIRFPPILAPMASAVRFTADLRLDGAAVQIDIRDGTGPSLYLAADGKLSDGGRVLTQVPVKQWFHLEVLARFGSDANPATHDVTMTVQGGTPQRFPDLPTPNPAWKLCDWTVIFGPGQGRGRFFVDNVLIEAVAPDGKRRPTFAEDAEGPIPGETGGPAAPDPFALLTDLLNRYSPPPIRVTAPATVHAGFFRFGDDVLVHLHDTAASWQNWGKGEGPMVTIEGTLPLQGANRPLSGNALALRRKASTWRLEAPVALYEIVKLRAKVPPPRVPGQ
jgi:hypothetical protein